MAQAIQTLEAHPPTAGIKASPTVSPANCLASTPVSTGKPLPAPGVAALPGRSLLHTVPDANCLMGKHIVEGDKVLILNQVPGWTQIRYTHPLTSVVTVGWLVSERVKPIAPHDQARTDTALTH